MNEISPAQVCRSPGGLSDLPASSTPVAPVVSSLPHANRRPADSSRAGTDRLAEPRLQSAAVQAWEIKQALSLPELLRRDNVELRKAGRLLIALCPFHSERSGSFTVWSDAGRSVEDHAHCYGCGWHGDVFAYWMARRGVDFATAKAELAAMAGLGIDGGQRLGVRGQLKKKAPELSHRSTAPKKTHLPELDKGTPAQIEELAALRGLKVEALRVAVELGLLRFAMWPQFQKWEWFPGRGAVPSWVITDGSGHVAQFRRLDGELYEWSPERKIKAWTKGSPSWPVGLGRLKSEVRNILVVEGGPDLLAAIQFLLEFAPGPSGGWSGDVLPMAMLGASCRISDEAMAAIQLAPGGQARRVRIIKHADAAGDDAAKRWKELTNAGCAVDAVSVAELLWPKSEIGGQKSDDPNRPSIKDLNDLIRQPREVWGTRAVRRAFVNWDF
jgi:hypothetical protein